MTNSRVTVSMEFTVELPEGAIKDDPTAVRLSIPLDAILVTVDDQSVTMANVTEATTTHVEFLNNDHE